MKRTLYSPYKNVKLMTNSNNFKVLRNYPNFLLPGKRAVEKFQGFGEGALLPYPRIG